MATAKKKTTKADTPEKVFACEHCKFIGKNGAGLKRHVSIKHTDVKPKKSTKAKSAQKKSKKFDHDKAFAWFLEDATRSYGDVAKQFKVTKQAIERIAKVTLDDGSWCTWAERRQMLGDEARKKLRTITKKRAGS